MQFGMIIDMGAMRGRLKQATVLDALHNLGPRTRDALAAHFCVPPATVQTHLVALRDRGEIYTSAWVEPEASGQWSPVWAVQTRPASLSVPRPVSARGHRVSGRQAEEEIDPVLIQEIVKGEGVKKEHALMARALGVLSVEGDALDVGIFGRLVDRRPKVPPAVPTGRPRGRPRTVSAEAR